MNRSLLPRLLSPLRPIILILLFALPVRAWGPHGQITQAALDGLGKGDTLLGYLGEHGPQLTNYAWMADYRRVPFEESGNAFYADDYLLFPGVPVHWDHLCPQVTNTFRPYFHRAIQALRTETPANAARWIGSLLHFVEDTGSPPHAAEIRGAMHSKMENWVDAAAIHIPDYRPACFGRTEEQALTGFLRRMDGLIAFSKLRGDKARLPVETGNRANVEPIVLESALETSRVVADLLRTLGEIGLAPARPGAALRGSVHYPEIAGMESYGAKVVLEGTPYSTLADRSGRFAFHDLPEGDYRMVGVTPAGTTARLSLSLQKGRTNWCELRFEGKPVNLIRNGDFALHWVSGEAPDSWNRSGANWESQIVTLKAGCRYRLKAQFKPDEHGEVVARWTRFLPHAVPRSAPAPPSRTETITPQNREVVFTGTEELRLFQLSLHCGKRRPEAVWKSISLEPLEDND